VASCDKKKNSFFFLTYNILFVLFVYFYLLIYLESLFIFLTCQCGGQFSFIKRSSDDGNWWGYKLPKKAESKQIKVLFFAIKKKVKNMSRHDKGIKK
jgi:hypothetical protein